jgi:hypothetical protein
MVQIYESVARRDIGLWSTTDRFLRPGRNEIALIKISRNFHWLFAS